jgi:hypothetical protein
MSTDDPQLSMQEWRWNAYRDHLEDLGYELDGRSTSADAEPAAIPVMATVTAGAEGPRPARPRPGGRPRS